MGHLSIAEAARIMGVSQQKLRIGIQRGRYPFGDAHKTRGEDGTNNTYTIYPVKFAQYYPYDPMGGTHEELT